VDTKSNHQMYCHECGNLISKNAMICPNCGVGFENATKMDSSINSGFFTTLLLCWFLGVFGIHRFYTGHTTIGILQLITLGGCGIWTIIDFILIVTGNFKDAQGNPIRSAV
jgi:TM2 domain-containing membrane protein YozV